MPLNNISFRVTSCPLRSAMLCHCGHVVAAVSTDAVSLLPDDGHNAAVLCLWPQIKHPLPVSNSWPKCNHSDAGPLGV